MRSDKQAKSDITKKHQLHETDTGSSDVQIALLTDRISCMSEHLKTNKKDFTTHHSLIKLVGQRRKLLNYLKANANQRYKQILALLDLRK